MRAGKRKFRKRFWLSFLLILAPVIFFTVVYADLSLEQFIFVLLVFIGIYVGGYISGYTQGRDTMREVLDFVEPGLRWKVMDAEEKLYELEDRDYEKGRKDSTKV